MIIIDGSMHEGGGQIVRTALALSTISRQAVRITNIRAGRKKPGLKMQHVKCVEALEQLCGATHSGVTLGSQEMEFIPGKLRAGSVKVDMETAGSSTLLLQSVLLPLACIDRACTLTVRGGTNAKWAMPVEYVQNVLLPHITPFFKKIDIQVLRRGYYPKGGGEIKVKVTPREDVSKADRFSQILESFAMSDITRTRRGELQIIRGIAHASDDLEPDKVAERMAGAALRFLIADKRVGHTPVRINKEYTKSLSTGAGVTIWAAFEDAKERFAPCIIGGDAIGDRGVRAEEVGHQAATHLLRHIEDESVVDPHIADNLIPFLALSGGVIKTSQITPHSRANMYVCKKILGTVFSVENTTISAQAGKLEVVF